MAIPELPAWVAERIKLWRDRLHLGSWTIHLHGQLCVEDDPMCLAATRCNAAYNTANIYVRADIDEDDPDWDEVIPHEVLHVAHAKIDAIVRDMFIENLPAAARPMAVEAYRQALESFIDLTAKAFSALHDEIEESDGHDAANQTAS